MISELLASAMIPPPCQVLVGERWGNPPLGLAAKIKFPRPWASFQAQLTNSLVVASA